MEHELFDWQYVNPDETPGITHYLECTLLQRIGSHPPGTIFDEIIMDFCDWRIILTQLNATKDEILLTEIYRFSLNINTVPAPTPPLV